MTKAIALFSGGLDSILAAKLVAEQGIEVEAVKFSTVFYDTSTEKSYKALKRIADGIGVTLKILDLDNEIFNIIKNPKHGFGGNMNPCIDCHAMMFKKAGEYMRSQGASFLITGEVLGERPMSQNRGSLNTVEKESGMPGLLLRPLSAQLLEPTIPEKEGLVDRSKLMAIKGRSRKPQIVLARRFGIKDYPNPAGGCLLTDPGFSIRLRELMDKQKGELRVDDVKLLKVGRHFRLSPDTKLVVGRNRGENKRLLNLMNDDDICFYPKETQGPTGLGRGIFKDEDIKTAAGILTRYCDKTDKRNRQVLYKRASGKELQTITVTPATEEFLQTVRI